MLAFVVFLILFTTNIFSPPTQKPFQFRTQPILLQLQGTTNCDVSSDEYALDSEEQKMLQLVNDYRAQHSLNRLTTSPRLAKVAAWMAHDIAAHNASWHEPDSLGRSYDKRLTDCDYHYQNTRENIYAGNTSRTGTAQEAFDAWVNSPEHNNNMLTSGQTVISTARAYNSNSAYEWFWLLNLGPFNDSGPIPTAPPQPTPTPIPTQPSVPTQPPVPTNPAATPTQAPLLTQHPTSSTQPTLVPTAIISNAAPTPTLAIPTSTPTSPPTPGPTLPPTEVLVSVKLPGIGSNIGEISQPVITEQNSTVYIYKNDTQTLLLQGEGKVTFEGTVFRGTIVVPNLPSGHYVVRVKTASSIRTSVSKNLISITNGAQVNLPQATVLTGDFDQNGIINLLDYNIFLKCFGVKLCDKKTMTDLNSDGKVEEVDFNIFLRNIAAQE